MALAYLFDPNKQFQDRNGVNNVAGFLRVYYEGTDDRATTYKNFIGTLNPADIPIDNDGRAVVIVEDEKTYRLEVYTRNGNLQWTQHPLCPLVGGGGSFDQVQSNWNEEDPTSAAFIKNKPDIDNFLEKDGDGKEVTVTFDEASARTNISTGEKLSVLFGKVKKFFSDLASVAFSGSYNDLSDKPTIPAAQVNSDWNANSGVAQILNKPNLATVATSGSYNDLSDKPTIPAAQVNSDWNANSGVAKILNKPNLATVATTGDYSDLDNKPVLVAKYGTTTYTEVNRVASYAGKLVVCRKLFTTAILIAEDGYSFTFATPPNAKGQYHVFTLNNDNSWTDQVVERTHDLICQLKPIVYAGATRMRYILCDRQKYNIENGEYVFKPVDLFELATWINRGDVIQIDGAVATDPWGDRYPMWITEMQCYTDGGTGKLYCGNIRVHGYAYSQTELSLWGDTIVDETTNKRYLEFQTWT